MTDPDKMTEKEVEEAYLQLVQKERIRRMRKDLKEAKP